MINRHLPELLTDIIKKMPVITLTGPGLLFEIYKGNLIIDKTQKALTKDDYEKLAINSQCQPVVANNFNFLKQSHCLQFTDYFSNVGFTCLLYYIRAMSTDSQRTSEELRCYLPGSHPLLNEFNNPELSMRKNTSF